MLLPVPPPPDPLVPELPPVVLTGVVEVVDAGGGGTPPQATISKALQSRSDIEDVRMACLRILFNSSGGAARVPGLFNW